MDKPVFTTEVISFGKTGDPTVKNPLNGKITFIKNTDQLEEHPEIGDEVKVKIIKEHRTYDFGVIIPKTDKEPVKEETEKTEDRDTETEKKKTDTENKKGKRKYQFCMELAELLELDKDCFSMRDVYGVKTPGDLNKKGFSKVVKKVKRLKKQEENK